MTRWMTMLGLTLTLSLTAFAGKAEQCKKDCDQTVTQCEKTCDDTLRRKKPDVIPFCQKQCKEFSKTCDKECAK